MTAAPPRATALHVAVAIASTFLLLSSAACSGEKGGAHTKTARAAASVDQESYGEVVIAPPRARYAAGPVASPGTVSGTVSLKGLNPLANPLAPLPPMPAGRDSALCGKVLPDSSLQQKGTGGGLGNVVVWLDGVRKGKAIPLEKRLELESDHCLLTPRVQAAVVGSAVNVIGHDDFRQHLRFVAAGEPQPRAAVLLGSNEQVIPTNLPANTPGMVIVKDADHPWPRAYLAVFDHPYYAVTRPDGSFSIDGVPPGRYTLVAWHERTGKQEQTVDVSPNVVTKVTLGLQGK